MPADIVLMIHPANLEGRALRTLHKELRRLIANGRRMVLNLACVDQMDSRGASVILGVARDLDAKGGSLKLIGVQNKVRVLFEILRMHRVIEMHAAHQDALTLGAAA